jgi:hypothetical protein
MAKTFDPVTVSPFALPLPALFVLCRSFLFWFIDGPLRLTGVLIEHIANK